jgi:hypothetical protein
LAKGLGGIILTHNPATMINIQYYGLDAYSMSQLNPIMDSGVGCHSSSAATGHDIQGDPKVLDTFVFVIYSKSLGAQKKSTAR